MSEELEQIEAELAAVDVSGYPTEPQQEWRVEGSTIFYGDYADEGEPDLLIEVQAAEYPDEVARFIGNAPLRSRQLLDAMAQRDTLRTALIEAQSWIEDEPNHGGLFVLARIREALEGTA